MTQKSGDQSENMLTREESHLHTKYLQGRIDMYQGSAKNMPRISWSLLRIRLDSTKNQPKIFWEFDTKTFTVHMLAITAVNICFFPLFRVNL